MIQNSPSIGSELNILNFLPWVYKATRLPLNSKSPFNLLTVRENHSWLEEDGPGSACTRSQSPIRSGIIPTIKCKACLKEKLVTTADPGGGGGPVVTKFG